MAQIACRFSPVSAAEGLGEKRDAQRTLCRVSSAHCHGSYAQSQKVMLTGAMNLVAPGSVGQAI